MKRQVLGRKYGRAVVTLVFGLVLVVSWFAAGTTPVGASQVNCTLGVPDSETTCGFGALIATTNGSSVASNPGVPDWTVKFWEHVYLSGTTYTYVFDTENAGPGPTNPTRLATSTFGTNYFINGAGQNYGYIDTPHTYVADATLPPGPTPTTVPAPGANVAFSFPATQFDTDITLAGGYPAGAELNYYAQSSLAPGLGTFAATGGGIGASTATSLDPSPNPIPEPSSLWLLGLGFPVMGGVLVARRRSLRYA